MGGKPPLLLLVLPSMISRHRFIDTLEIISVILWLLVKTWRNPPIFDTTWP